MIWSGRSFVDANSSALIADRNCQGCTNTKANHNSSKQCPSASRAARFKLPSSSPTAHRATFQQPHSTQGYPTAASQNTGVPYSSLTEHRGTLQEPQRTQGYPTAASQNTGGTLQQPHRTQGYPTAASQNTAVPIGQTGDLTGPLRHAVWTPCVLCGVLCGPPVSSEACCMDPLCPGACWVDPLCPLRRAVWTPYVL